MSALLSPPIDNAFQTATVIEKFFDEQERKKLRSLYEPREHPSRHSPEQACTTNLFFSFFLDGTKNNYVKAEPTKSLSNVARLYDCYPGQSVPGVLPKSTDWETNKDQYTHFFKVYAPGVSSPFKEVGDKSDWLDEPTGAASGRMGERRILWSLVQAINNVHRYFLKVPLVLQPEMNSMFETCILDKKARAYMTGQLDRVTSSTGRKGIPPDRMARTIFERMLRRLHKAVAQHWPDRRTGRPCKISPSIVKTIYISIFGFSRGATQARAFTNWLHSLCKLDAELTGRPGGMSLGGFPVQFDFLGLFDTVAAIGVGNTFGYTTGHGAWG